MATALKFIILFLIAYKVFSLLLNNNQQKVNTKEKQQFKQTTTTESKTHYEDAEFIDYEEVK
ncbi:MAG: hypothetical protein H6553_11915 [Chitinophagales bacterium]|nr:hypothetical protein [Chitinophagales bacterium]